MGAVKKPILITVEGGVVQDVEAIPKGVVVKVMDFDVEGVDPEDLHTSVDGDPYSLAEWYREGKRPEAGREIVVTVSGGVIQDIEVPKGLTVEVWDFDTDGVDEELLEYNERGEAFVRSVWESVVVAGEDKKKVKLPSRVDVTGSPVGREWQSQEGLKRVIGLLGEDRVVIETPSSRESGFGHHVLPLTELEDEIDLDERKAASAGRMAQRVATAEAKEEAALAEREDTEGFADQFSPLKRGRIIKTLNATMTLDRGPVKTRKQHVRDLVAKGFRPAVVPGVGEVLQGPDETYYRAKDLTKTAIDYAAWLTR